MKNQLTFVYYICILQPCFNCILVLWVFVVPNEDSLDFPTLAVISSVNICSLFLPFHSLYFLLSFIFIFCHIELGRTSSTCWMWNKSGGKEGHPCFLPNVRKKVSRFSLLSMISDIYTFCRFLNQITDVILYFNFPECFFFFLSRIDEELCQMLFLHQMIWLYNLKKSIDTMIYVNWFSKSWTLKVSEKCCPRCYLLSHTNQFY